jgi:carbon-monoxide dehydrogenase medium subunit
MHYHRPTTLQEALQILAGDENARCLAGGATLVAMLNANLLQPSALVSLKRIDELREVQATGSGVAIGAMVRHQTVADEQSLQGGLAVIRLAAGQIGHPAIRSVGTIGGSISHADPAADYPTALLAAGAQIEVASTRGRRRIAVDDFFQHYYTTALEAGEMVVAVHLPAPLPGAVSSYRKIARADGDFATVSLAFVGTFAGDRLATARVAVGGCAATPIHDAEVDALLAGAALSDPRIAEAAAGLAAACDPVDDVRGSAAYRRVLVQRLLPRVLAAAHQSAQTGRG